MQGELLPLVEQYGEEIGIVAVIISSFLYRHLRGEWPLLNNLRRKLLPFLHEVILEPAGEYAAREQYEKEYVGTYDTHVDKLHKLFRSHSKIFPNNFAAIKYLEDDSGERHHEHSSWAWRPGGLTGKFQVHLMVYKLPKGRTEIYAHWELNPIPNPIAHYKGSKGAWDIHKGVEKARNILSEGGLSREKSE